MNNSFRNTRLRGLALTSYPIEAAATRFRVQQFVGPLKERGIEMEIRPFLSSARFGEMYAPGGAVAKAAGIAGSLLRRLGDVANARRYDLLFVQREAMFFGPEVFEWLLTRVRWLPLVLDLDDATYVPYKSPTYGSVGSKAKFFGKTDRLIDRAAAVTCGNRFIAEYVERRGTQAVVVPTVVDTMRFTPADAGNDPPVIGWIGTHSTYPSLEWLFPVLERLARHHRFTFRIIGSGRDSVAVPGVDVRSLPWSMDREVDDFRTLDIGLYPIVTSPSASEEWIRGKSGFKAVQYMAVGVPFVMSPVGICAEMGVASRTHFCAETAEDWYNSLNTLLSDRELRVRMGREGREFALRNFTVDAQADKLASVFAFAAGGGVAIR